MSFKIAGGAVSLNNLRHLRKSYQNISKSTEKISSGMRINRAADDAAGLAVSEKMRGQINGLDQAVENTQHAISMLQVADGALDTIHSVLQRMRKLAVQASNDSYTLKDRKDIQSEMDRLVENIDQVSENTEYNTKKLLNGDTVATTFTSDSLIGTVEVNEFSKEMALSITVVNSGTRHKLYSNKRLDLEQSLKEYGVEGVQNLEINGRIIEVSENDRLADLVKNINEEDTSVEASVESGRLLLQSKFVGSEYMVEFGKDSTVLHALGLDDDKNGYFSRMPSDTIISIVNISDADNVINIGRFTSTDRVFDKKDFARLDGTEFDMGDITIEVNHLLDKKYEPKEADIAFIIDITGSMGAEIDTLKSAMDDIVTRLQDNNVNGRFAFMAYANDVDTHPRFDFITDINQSKANIQTIRNLVGTAGIGGQEDLHHAMDWAADNFAWLNDEKYMIALTDEDDDYAPITPAQITQKLTDADITFGAIRNPGFGNTANDIDGVATATDGFLLDISTANYADISDNIIEELAPVTASFKVAIMDATQRFQVGANEDQLAELKFGDLSSEKMGFSKKLVNGENLAEEKILLLSVETQENAERSISDIEKQLEEVSTLRTKIGGFQNMLEKSMDFLFGEMQELQASESNIRNIDVAHEMTSVVKEQLLNDSGINSVKFIRQSVEQIYSMVK